MIRHVDEVLKLLSVMTGDKRYEEILLCDGKDVNTMCDVAERLENKGRLEGRLDEIFSSVEAHDYSMERGAEKAQMNMADFKQAMKEAGYHLP